MNKIKIIFVCLLIPLFIFIAFTFLKIKNKEEFQQKAVLAKEIRKVLDYMMFDIYQARKGSFEGVPADGLWHNRIAFIRDKQGAWEYVIRDRHLLRTNKGKTLLIADNISELLVRHQKETPDILEVQIKAQKNVSLMTYLKIRIRQ